ncbi:MAG: hypothetical protein H6812_05405 [Phycisphaeraceae bacterium]|nr:hypothetical protein [Phycisphaerales bacterium]MCB9842678.1 hypothetical protein [Phycisphaeraceae bacterium]
MPIGRLIALGWFLVAAVAMTGCASDPVQPHAASRVESSRYAAAFRAAKDVLRDEGFVLDRVDARRGVITTLPRASAGLASPWISTGSAGDAASDLLHAHARSATVDFGPASGASSDDLRESAEAIEIRVTVHVLRASKAGRRVDSTMPRRSTFAVDPVATRSGDLGTDLEEIALDERLADRLAERIRALANAR